MRRTFSLWLMLLTLGSLSAQELPRSGPLPEVQHTGIEYPTVAEALRALTARNDVTVSTNRGWTIITDQKNLTLWSFAPDSYPAHPAVVKRVVLARADGGSDINMSVLCEATKEACDQLVREFDAMNQRLSQGGITSHGATARMGA